MEELIRKTSRSLAMLTLLLIAILLAAVGFVTAAVAMNATDQSVDRTLLTSAARMADSVSGAGESEEGQASEADEHPPEASDTFFLVLDGNAKLLANPQRVGLTGLPNADAVAAAMASPGGQDWRTVEVGGVN